MSTLCIIFAMYTHVRVRAHCALTGGREVVHGAGVVPSPFDYSDVVTTTTHKSLRGPRGAMIFFRKGVKGQDKKGKDVMYDLESKINFAVFPGAQVRPAGQKLLSGACSLFLGAPLAFVQKGESARPAETFQAACTHAFPARVHAGDYGPYLPLPCESRGCSLAAQPPCGSSPALLPVCRCASAVML